MYDASIDIKKRTFLLFSVAVLVALFLAVPFGLIMREPLSATISTVVGAVFFTLYVVFSFRKKRIKTAKIVISVILVLFSILKMVLSEARNIKSLLL